MNELRGTVNAFLVGQEIDRGMLPDDFAGSLERFVELLNQSGYLALGGNKRTARTSPGARDVYHTALLPESVWYAALRQAEKESALPPKTR